MAVCRTISIIIFYFTQGTYKLSINGYIIIVVVWPVVLNPKTILPLKYTEGCIKRLLIRKPTKYYNIKWKPLRMKRFYRQNFVIKRVVRPNFNIQPFLKMKILYAHIF